MLGKEASLVPPAESPGRTDSTLQGPEGMGVAHLPPTPTIGQEGGSERLEGSEGGLDNKYFPQSTRQGVSSGPVRENCSQRAWLASPRLPAVRTERSNLSGEEVSPCKHPTLVRLGGVRPTPDLVAKTEAATKVSETFNQLMIHLSDNNKILTEGSNRASSVGMATLVPSTPTAFRKSSWLTHPDGCELGDWTKKMGGVKHDSTWYPGPCPTNGTPRVHIEGGVGLTRNVRGCGGAKGGGI